MPPGDSMKKLEKEKGVEMKLQGKVALVTGGGSGIGEAIARRFVEEGAKVCISGRRRENLDRVVASLPAGTTIACPGDTANDGDVSRMVATTIEFGGTIDVLVNNAAISANGPAGDMDRTVWHHVLDVNLSGPFRLIQETLPHMIKGGGGSIINIASVGGLRCLPAMPAYCVSKAGLIMLTKQVALDYGVHRIRCNAVCPGAVKTDMVATEFGQIGKSIGIEQDDFFSMVSQVLPLRRFAEPDEIGGVCTFLAGDDSSFMTGAALVIDAGTAVVDPLGAEMMGAVRRYSETKRKE
jgi:meso-butanediol dehydrogenase / (S,S)-butanediol dehydrogenase / diacetyl reductase